ncbi:MAG: hypothetical protein K5863_17340 [Nitratireductor sp.]|uniref:hypothetical protein n=1 Tax=Nitratireductor sp. TaxID=1872084 RepID=UPI00263045B9|nr:hypothetical protein [Nitratireductor sp.]MCV0351845.1 hypothetical protein [Nitratireductor sp.]
MKFKKTFSVEIFHIVNSDDFLARGEDDIITTYKEKMENILSQNNNILRILSDEVAKQGFAGSTKIPELVYLTLITGLLEEPVSLLIKGPSGAGKSFSLRMGKQFIPTEAYEEFEGMSEKALVYLDIDLKHKHLIIGEAAGMANGSGRTLIRQLLSEGQVRYATVQSTDRGLEGAELPALEGPCGLIMTTTATNIHPEDENRMLSMNMHESPDQIMAALIAQAEGNSKKKYKPNLAPWFELYRSIKNGSKNVSIPFAKKIAKQLPLTHDKIKRDFPQVLSLIKASALIHSKNRAIDEDGAVVANEDDYALVRNLVNAALSEGLAKTVPATVRKLVEAVEKLTDTRHKGALSNGVSHSKLAEYLDRDQSVISRTAKQAVEDGYLRNNNPGQGREAELVVGDRKLPSGSVLPSTNLLFDEQPEREYAPWECTAPAKPKRRTIDW